MLNIYAPLKHTTAYAVCIDDSLPSFTPKAWIQKDKIYKVKFFADTLNTESGYSLVLVDKEGKDIYPSDSHKSFDIKRFTIISIFLN